MASFSRLWIGLVAACAAFGANVGAQATDVEAQSRALERAAQAVVGVQAQSVADARSAATLGRQRAGSGVVIAPDGLVLTIGYLILEAEQVQLVLDDGRKLPARVVGYDLATGFGLLAPLAPIGIAPAPMGRAAGVTGDETLMIAGSEGLSAARLVSRRAFAGYWEYRIEGALFTAPARTDHSGAGLFNARGELVGIGSLVVANALGDDHPRAPGNMFVPTDLLAPILGELRTSGSSAASRRAWLGLNAVEHEGRVRVVRVAEDSPAEVAGVRVGDRIVALDGSAVATLDALWTRLWRGAAEREVQLEIERDGARQTLAVRTADRQRQLRKAAGV